MRALALLLTLVAVAADARPHKSSSPSAKASATHQAPPAEKAPPQLKSLAPATQLAKLFTHDAGDVRVVILASPS